MPEAIAKNFHFRLNKCLMCCCFIDCSICSENAIGGITLFRVLVYYQQKCWVSYARIQLRYGDNIYTLDENKSQSLSLLPIMGKMHVRIRIPFGVVRQVAITDVTTWSFCDWRIVFFSPFLFCYITTSREANKSVRDKMWREQIVWKVRLYCVTKYLFIVKIDQKCFLQAYWNWTGKLVCESFRLAWLSNAIQKCRMDVYTQLKINFSFTKFDWLKIINFSLSGTN